MPKESSEKRTGAAAEPAMDLRAGAPVEAAAEPEDHIDEGTELGAVQIHNNVIATIARLAALKVAGVAEMSGTFVDGLAGMIGRKQTDRGIRVELTDGSVAIDLHVVLEFGVRIPQVAWQVQNEVRQAIEQMTGKAVKAVNVIVQSMRFPGENAGVAEEGGSV
jgi:uncharacterized alkaline shock family protein YloU